MDKEDHELLHWAFHQTHIPSVIDKQSKGKKLCVPNVGEFLVEWHMAGDLKTLKCMYNVSKGGNSKSPCLYCMAPASVLDSEQQTKKPSRAKEDLNFHPVLNIPLTHVHVCTLHALCRIIEKLVFLYIQFAWKLEPKSDSEEGIKKIEEILSEMGLHGGQVKIVADTKRSTASHQVPIKPSLGGVKARRFLSFHGEQGKINKNRQFSTIKYGLWKKLHNAVKDHGDNGEARNRKAEVWISLDEVFRMLDMKVWKRDDILKLKMALRTFGKSMQEAWSEQSITHYMVKCLFDKFSYRILLLNFDIQTNSSHNLCHSTYYTIISHGLQTNMDALLYGLHKEWRRLITKHAELTSVTPSMVVEQSEQTVSRRYFFGSIEESFFEQESKNL